MTLKVKVIYGLAGNIGNFENEFEAAINELDSLYRNYTFRTTYIASEDRLYAFIEYAPQPDPLPQKPPEEY